jgi:hypothetical protein
MGTRPDPIEDDLDRLRWHVCPSKLAEAEVLSRVLEATGWTQRALAETIGWEQPLVSRRLARLKEAFQPRPVEPYPGRTGRWSTPPPADAPEKLHVLWCAHLALDFGWSVSVEHPVERGPQQTSLRCDLVLSRPGEWRPRWAIEVKRTLPAPATLQRAYMKMDEYAGRLQCDGLLVVPHLPAKRSVPVIAAENLGVIVGAA